MAFARLLAFGAALTCAGSALALDQGDYRFNGFGTAGITHLGGEDDGRSFGINGQTNDHWRGDQLSKLGGQFQYGLTDKLDATVQVSSRLPTFRLTAARVVEGPFRATVLEAAPGAPRSIKLSSTLTTAPKIYTRGKLILESNDPLEPRKEVVLSLAAAR